MDCYTPGFPVHHYLLEFAQTHVLWVDDSIQQSHPLFPPLFNLSQHQGLFQWVGFFTSGGQSIGASASVSVLPIFRVDFLSDWLVGSPCCLRTLKSPLQHHSSKASVLQCSTFFMVQLSHPYMAGKTIALTIWTFVGKAIFLLFNIWLRFVIAFLPRRRRFLISWLQSPSAVILEPKRIKSVTVSIVSPSICH